MITNFLVNNVNRDKYNNNNDDNDGGNDDDYDANKRVFKEDKPKSTNTFIICLILMPEAAILWSAPRIATSGRVQ